MRIGESIKLLHSIVTRISSDVVEKKYTNNYERWTIDELLSNEVRALEITYGLPGMQKILKRTSNSLFSEYCGEKLNDTTITSVENKEKQAEAILESLRVCKILHRDITPKNIVVKNGIMTLIDFTWASFPGSIFEKEHKPPFGLGEPWKAPDGFDDRYSLALSMRRFK